MRQAERGFTLIELMVVVSIVGVLAILGVPRFKAYVLEARLNDAQPYLVEIAAKMRMRLIEQGDYCCDADPSAEANIESELGVAVDEAGDFCFMIVCKDAALCATVTATNFITPAEVADAAPEFEVWAVLRDDTGATVSGPGGATCTPHPSKRPPTGWTGPSTSTEPGREGQAVAFRYPPPVNGIDATTGTDGHRYVWDAGLSKTHALQP